jgi:hypothetical protein
MIRCTTLFFLFFIILNSHSYGKEDVSQITSDNFKQELDTTGINITYYKKDLRRRHHHNINIFINKVLYKSDIYPENGYIYIPDTLKQNDKIKITDKLSGSGQRWTNQIVKRKSYTFNYSESDEVYIEIKYKKGFNLFRRKPCDICPANFY